MGANDIDPSVYVRPPVLDVASAIALATALLAAAPKDLSDSERRAAKRLRKDSGSLQDAWAKADAAAPVADRRKVDTRVDNAWAILLDRAAAYASLPVATYPRADRARAIVTAIAPDRAWLKLPYAAEWAESDKRLKRIDADGLAPELDALAGPEFLAEVRAAHAEHGLALGIKSPIARPAEVSLADPLRAVALSVVRYARAVVGGLDEDDAASVDRTRAALAPIDDHRDGQWRRASGGAVPDAPPAPAAPTPDP